jgi:hypothetical protein
MEMTEHASATIELDGFRPVISLKSRDDVSHSRKEALQDVMFPLFFGERWVFSLTSNLIYQIHLLQPFLFLSLKLLYGVLFICSKSLVTLSVRGRLSGKSRSLDIHFSILATRLLLEHIIHHLLDDLTVDN